MYLDKGSEREYDTKKLFMLLCLKVAFKQAKEKNFVKY